MTCAQIERLVGMADDYNVVRKELNDLSLAQIVEVESHRLRRCACFKIVAMSKSPEEALLRNMAIAISDTLRSKRIGSSRGRPVATIGVPGLA